jgi:carbon monoxide dehydrogenase subunit G
MRIETGFTLDRPPAEAYGLLLDLERVAPCFPGAELGGDAGEGARAVTVTVRLGPMRLVYDGTVRIVERDDAARRAVLSGDARDRRGAGTARAEIAMTVAPNGDGSHVDAVADVELAGRAAQLGKGIVEDVSRRLVADMATCLAERFAGPAAPAAAPPGELRAGGMFFRALWTRIKALFGRRG